MWIDKSTGIAIGWNFWYSMAITMPTEISAATALVNFWTPSLNHAVPISCLWLLIAIINFSPVRVYGEFEFYFAFCKVSAHLHLLRSSEARPVKIALIITFIIAGIVLDAGGLPGQERIGFRYWQDPYPLFREYIKTGPCGRFLGFWSTMISATFAYGNVQVVAIAGAETRNPRRSIPSALKKTFTRVILFYVVSVFVISLTVPANDERLNAPGDISRSPFVIAFTGVGIKTLPSIINAIVFTSAFSSGNACTFLASRTLHGLALDGHAPSVFLKLNRYQVPYMAVAASVVWGGIAYASLNRSAYQAFSWLVSLVTTSGIISWVIIGITYIRFFRALKVQGIQREFLPYKSPFQPYITMFKYYGLVMNLLVLIFSGWNAFSPRFDASLFASNYLNCFIYPVLYLALKMWLKDGIIPLDDIDFESEFATIKAEEERDDYSHDDFRGTYYDRILNALF
ncbi:hypothetical protein NLJ89_g4227 [Agrocybe chaxingu]|uniref:Amino acid permease/ SLC12A domain-containing protein n=1 Tax=Agrocybe chaxingu TaxID=84603 RepID=A0A9W8K4D7_9AGAR|nr:hypothetical protein NLJ89_g4227 [Agrocybe chaxingu]